MQFDADQLDWAAGVVRRRMPATAQYAWPLLCEMFGAEVWVKHENHTPTGAFKVRGGLVYAERLLAQRPGVNGIVSATRGNHGQSLAFAGTALGLRVTIVVPKGNSPDKNAAMRAFGAELIVAGHDFQAARERGVDRGEISPDLAGFAVDLVYGSMWYRLIFQIGPLDYTWAESVVASITSGGPEVTSSSHMKMRGSSP
jgi:threonine dehydratase